MVLSQEKKLEIAQLLRSPGTLPFHGSDSYLDRLKQVSKETLYVPTSVGDSTCYLVRPLDRQPNDLLLVNIHGGGFVQQHSIWDEALCATYALELGCTVLDVDYRLAPEFPYPTPVLECYDVVQWALANAPAFGADPQKVVVGGNSAGATLTACACIMAEEKQGLVPAMVILVYPAGDMEDNVSAYPLTPEELDVKDLSQRSILYNALYVGEDQALYESPYVCLNKATEKQLSRFPEAVVVTAGQDPLRYGGERFAGKAAASGSKITLKRYPASDHGFYVRCIGPEWQQARDLVMDAVCGRFGLIRNKLPD